MVAVITTTTLLALIKLAFKKIRIIALTLIALIIGVIVLRSINVFGLHSNIIGFVVSSLIMLIVSWELFRMPRVRYILLIGATGFTMLGFD